MKKIACFSIPAHGHTNPMLPVVKELVERGDIVRFYSFDEFEAKIRATGAVFISCDRFLTKEEKKSDVATSTEMTIADIHTVMNANSFLESEFRSFKPDVVYSDSVCFWAKLNAKKYNVPLVVSTTTFAFNQLSATYMKNSLKEVLDLILGLGKVKKELIRLEQYGFKVKSPIELVQSDNSTDSIVYTTKAFQPYAESFSSSYAFVGPSILSDAKPIKDNKRPLIYISLGTVVNNRPDFYKNAMKALRSINADAIISVGKEIKTEELGEVPDNVKLYNYVDQLDVLSRANLFITHAGMNSASESLYMATPMILFPQTGEQKAVAIRVTEERAGIMLKSDSAQDIKEAIERVLNDESYSKNAKKVSEDFRGSSGYKGAADFIENAPHKKSECFVMDEITKSIKRFNALYATFFAVLCALAIIFRVKYFWPFFIAAGILNQTFVKAIQKKKYNSLSELLGN